jgi:hypothetical protein
MEPIPRPALALAPPSLLGPTPTAIQQSSTYAVVTKWVPAAAPTPSNFKARTNFLKSRQGWIKNRCIRCGELGHNHFARVSHPHPVSTSINLPSMMVMQNLSLVPPTSSIIHRVSLVVRV